jgi:hypothetical protein
MERHSSFNGMIVSAELLCVLNVDLMVSKDICQDKPLDQFELRTLKAMPACWSPWLRLL